MNTPFSKDQFIDVFKNYNETKFPLHVLFYFFAIVAVYVLLKQRSTTNRIINLILSFFWLWMGIIYHILFFTSINKAAYIFGALFIVQGILFLIYGLKKNKLSFHFHPDRYGLTGIGLIIFSMVIYPILSFFNGHVYPSSPTFGLPCPTTIFTFGILLQSTKRCPPVVLIIPFLWSIIGFTAAFNFGVSEDVGLLVAGVLSFTLLLIRNKKIANE